MSTYLKFTTVNDIDCRGNSSELQQRPSKIFDFVVGYQNCKHSVLCSLFVACLIVIEGVSRLTLGGLSRDDGIMKFRQWEV